MPFVLRTIRLSRWDNELMLGAPWLPDGDFVADPLADLATERGVLSVWLVEDDRSNLDRVLVALAATRDHLSNVDYLILDEHLVAETGVVVRQTTGATPDHAANVRWHRDLIEVSGHRLAGLAGVALTAGQIGRLHQKPLRRLLQQALETGHVDPARLRPCVLSKLTLA